MGGSLLLNEIFEHIPTDLRKVFVETGTYKGETTRTVSPHFEQVITVEIFKPLFEEAKASFETYHNIIAYLGNSVQVLDQPETRQIYKHGAVFFLDAHVSGRDSSYDPDLPVPLLEEIKTINKEPLGKSLFIIDDLRLWKNNDWPVSSASICEQFRPGQIVNAYESNDRYWILTK